MYIKDLAIANREKQKQALPDLEFRIPRAYLIFAQLKTIISIPVTAKKRPSVWTRAIINAFVHRHKTIVEFLIYRHFF